MTEVDGNSVNAELEVKKLQELVRKLERQNEQLRTRVSGCSGPLPTVLCQSSLGSFASSDEPFDYFHPHTVGDEAAAAEEEVGPEHSVLDELELLDLDSLCCSDECDETWLYVSSKATECTDKSNSPLQWSRQVLDSARSDVEAARQSLVLRLEQVCRWRSSLSSSTPSSSTGPSTPSPGEVTGVSPISTPPSAKSCSISRLSERHAPALPYPLHPVVHQNPSLGGKEVSPVAERSPTFLHHPASRSRSPRCSAVSPQSCTDRDVGASEVENSSICLGYKLQDLTDVQVMARLQEESLRQAYASTSSILANCRSRSFSFQLSNGLEEEDEEEDEEDDEDYSLLPPPPRLCLGRVPRSHTFSTIQDWERSTSSLSGPLYPSSGFVFRPQLPGSLCAAEELGFRPGSGQLQRRSFVSRPPLKATAYVSPTIKGLASMLTSTNLQSLSSTYQSSSSPRSSLPRPASFVGTTSYRPCSKVAQPSPSLPTHPKSLSTLSVLVQDGCY